MNRKELESKLLRLLGREGFAAAVGDLENLGDGEQLPTWLARLVEAAGALPLPEVPPVVSQELHYMFEGEGLIEPHSAVLVRDTRVDKRMVGARGADVAQGWSLTYTSPVADVVLDVWPTADAEFEVVGHIMGHGGADSAYRVSLTGAGHMKTDSDRLGRFRFDSMSAGSYELVIVNQQAHLTAQVELGV